MSVRRSLLRQLDLCDRHAAWLKANRPNVHDSRGDPDNDDIKLRELLERFGLIERFTPYVSGGRGAVRGDEAREWLTDRRNEAVAEVTLVVSAVAMVAAIVAALRR
jgi:hypothetical protein